MENNAQRFKGTDFVAENSTYQPNQPQLNFNSEEYYYSNASLPFQNYQNPYRSPYEASSNYEPSTYEHAYERPPNPYSASPQAIIPSYQEENYQNYGELQATAPHYESFYPEGERNPYYNPNFTPPNYTRTEMSAQNYYQGAAHDIYAANVHGYNSASFQSTPDGNSYRFRQNINITHPNTKFSYAKSHKTE
ncbi:hypothetical protein HZS_6231 [Henneguya salminicola]|nr:hypothetical protein HZS_6231 [Henneguya salminicola]